MSDISIAESKIQILYLVDRAPGVSYNLLMEKCMESLYTDFFTFSRSYEELISGNLMDKSSSEDFTPDAIGSTEKLTLTDGGKAVLTDLLPSLSTSLIQNLDNAAEEIRSDMAKTSGDGRPFTASVTVDDEATALKLCKNWKNSCSKAPGELIRLITGS